MELSLKDRKSINNGAIKLHKYVDALTPNWKAWDGGPILSGNKLANNISGLGGVSITQDMQSPSLNIPTKLPDDIRTPERDALSRGTKIKPQAESSLKDAAGGIIQNAIGTIGTMVDIAGDYKTKDQFIQDAGVSTDSVGGISYRKINNIYKNGKMPKYAQGFAGGALKGAGSTAALGATVGSVIPGFGTVAGGIVGAALGGITGGILGSSAADEEERQKEAARKFRLNFNNFEFDNAFTKNLKLNEAEKGYKCGKMPKYNNGKVDSSFGLTYLPKNSYTEKGEWIGNLETKTIHKVNRGPNDTAPSYVGPNDFVLRNREKNGLPSPAKYFEATGDIYGALELNEAGGAVSNNRGKAKIGKMPRFKEGWLPNAIVSGIGGLMGLNQYLDARNQSIYRPNTYAPNTYEGRALPGLASLRYNQYPILNQINNQRAAYDYALNNSGGLSGAQKYLGKIANANNMYRTSADLLTNLQERNIGLKQNYYNTMLNVGAQDAQRRMAANQYDLDYYSKAHAARQQGMQMGMYNMLNQLQQYYANDFKRRQFNDTLSMYREDQKLKRSELAMLEKSLKGK